MQANILWTGREYYSLENCLINIDKAGATIDSAIVGLYGDTLYRVGYKIETDTQWKTRSIELTTQVFNEQLQKRYESDGAGKWMCEGRMCEKFTGCIDVDIPLTPFTNTLPIRRLQLSIGETREIRVAYFDILAKEIRAVRQKYHRLTERQYKYENVPNDFEAIISVDQDGFVVDYPSLFMRTARKDTEYNIDD